MNATAATDKPLQRLAEKYPRLFHGRGPRGHSWVEPGWFEVVDEVCAHVDSLLTDAQADEFEILQIKEKLGGLRFYFRFVGDMQERLPDAAGAAQRAQYVAPREAVARLLRVAEERAAHRCQRCGAPGWLRNATGQIATLCASHRTAGDARSRFRE